MGSKHTFFAFFFAITWFNAFALPEKLKIKVAPIQNSNILHPLAVRANLLQLNATLNALENSNDGRHADLLLQKATRDAWSAVQNAVKPLTTTTSSRRRRLAATTPTNSIQQRFNIPPEIINELTNRFRSSVQKAMQNPNITQAVLSSLSPSLQNMTLASAIAQNINSGPLANITQAIKQYREISDMMENIFTAASKTIPLSSSQSTNNNRARRLHQSSSAEATVSAEKTIQHILSIVPKLKKDGGPAFSAASSSTEGASLQPLKPPARPSISDLQERVRDSLQSLQRLGGGATLPSESIADQLAAHAKGLEDRYKVLQEHFNEPYKVKIRSNRNLRHYLDDSDGDFEGENDMYNYADSEDNTDDGDAWLPLSSPRGTTSGIHKTIVMYMASEDAAQSGAMLNDMLSFLQHIMNVAQPLDYESYDANSYYVDGENDDGSANDDEYTSEEDVEQSANADENTFSNRRRQMLGASSSSQTNSRTNANDYDYDLEEAYDAAWLLAEEEDDLYEAALIGYDKSSRDDIVDLFINLMAPVDQGGIPTELLRVLSDPANNTISDLLEILSSTPGSIHLEASSAQQQQQEGSNLPRFAVFGSSALPNGMHAAAVGPDHHKPSREYRNNVADLIQPLSSAVKAPTVHSSDSAEESTMDARWWGVVLSLGALGLLLVGAALAAMSRGSFNEHQLLLDESVRAGLIGGGGGKERTLQNDGHAKQGGSSSPKKEKPNNSQRKTSHLPA